MKVSDLKEFDAADFINDREDLLHYLNIALEENNLSAFAEALETIARSEGMAKVSQGTGLTRDVLYKDLQTESSLRFDTIFRVCRSLGYQLALKPIEKN